MHVKSCYFAYLNQLPLLLETLSNDDDDGSENVAKKNEFEFFQTKSRLFGPAKNVKCRRLFLVLNS